MTSFDIHLKTLKTQFLSSFDVKLINFDNFKTITWEQQVEFLENTVDSNLNKLFPLRTSYQLMFLKKVIEYFEANDIEVHDRIYEVFCNLNNKKINNDNLAYKHYMISKNDVVISLKESKSFVAEGTTGLCSWKASLVLSNWLLNNVELVNCKTILELGAGTGLCSLTLLKCCCPREIMISDGSITVLELLYKNLEQNFDKLKEIEVKSIDEYRKYSLNDKTSIKTMLFPWEDVDSLDLKNKVLPDIILAADVLYDDSVFASLSNSIEYIFNYMNDMCVMYLAATVRNRKTLDYFKDIIKKQGFDISRIMTNSDKIYFNWDNTTSIEIYCLKKCKSHKG